eukprot:524189-Rhodomonas_salina.4
MPSTSIFIKAGEQSAKMMDSIKHHIAKTQISSSTVDNGEDAAGFKTLKVLGIFSALGPGALDRSWRDSRGRPQDAVPGLEVPSAGCLPHVSDTVDCR